VCSIGLECKGKSRRSLARVASFLIPLFLSVAGARTSAAAPLPCSVSLEAVEVSNYGYKDAPVEFSARARLLHCNFSGPISFSWAFGDGENGSGSYTWHVYRSGQTYPWALTVEAKGVTATTSGTIQIDPQCHCVFPEDVIGPFGGEAGDPVVFALLPPAACCPGGPSKVKWDFGDDSAPVEDVLSTEHPYAKPGVYQWSVHVEYGDTTDISGEVAIGPDLVADRIEVVQAVQDLKNSVRLVAGKSTFVRFYAHSARGNHPVSARLTVRGTKGAILYPINPGGKVVVRPNYFRAVLDHAFLFEVPSELLHGDDVSFEAEVNPRPYDFGPLIESDHVFERDGMDPLSINNNHVEVHVAFEDVPPLYLILYDVQWTTLNNREIRQGDFHQSMMESWLRRAFPIHELNVIRRSYDYAAKHGLGVPVNTPANDLLNQELVKLRDENSHALWVQGVPKTARYYGMVWDGDDPDGFVRGLGEVGGFVAAGGAGVPVEPWDLWDTDGSWGDYYGAHELGHNFGLRHPGTPGTTVCKPQTRTQTNPVYPYPEARITGALSGDDAFYGFDALTHVLYGTYSTDLMSYCQYRWISDFTFKAIMDRMQLEARTGGGAAAAASTTDRLVVVGTIHPATNTISLQPLFILPNAEEIQTRVPGPYAIVLRTAAGAELARYPFTPFELQSDPAPSQGAPSEPETALSVDEMVPYVTGTDRVDIEGPGGSVLKTVTAGSHPPSVHILSPNGGEVLSGATIPVSWTGSDVDGDPLTFSVQYSHDNGSSWEMVAQDLTGTSAELDGINFPAGSNARIRVWASDGIHTAFDESDGAFRVPNHVPTVTITQPATDVTIAVGQTLKLEGRAYDIDTGTMPSGFSQSVDWTSDLDGYLGAGDSLSLYDLSEGVHTITFSADDGQGGTATGTVRVTVVATLGALPPVADALTVAPPLLAFNPDGGMISASVSVDNQNANAAQGIAWNAVPSAAWLQLSADAGETPAEINVSFDATGLTPGGYHGTITFTSDAVPGATQTVDVQLTIPGAPACTGDCGTNGSVTVDEILMMVNIALGNTSVSACDPGDGNSDGQITVDEILSAVNNALTGCAGVAPTLTPTVTAAAMTSTPTKTMTIPPATNPPVPSPTRTPSLPASATATRTPTGGIAQYCSDVTDQIEIPDEDPFGIASVLVINESLQINRLQINVWIEHSWVGDLVVTLTRLSDMTTVTLVDRPGYPVSMFGCGQADILCEFVDESTVPAETECRTDLAALQGSLQPAQPLAVFSGSDLAGSWQLGVADLSAGITGTLVQWCIDAY
jgi:subtilisin-like proprotein convertase family protein